MTTESDFQDRMNTAEDRLVSGIQSGSIDPVQAEEVVRSMSLAQGTTDMIISKIRSVIPAGAQDNTAPAEPAPAPEVTVGVPQSIAAQPEQSPVSPVLGKPSGSFFSSPPQTDFFSVVPAVKTKQPLRKEKASELGFAVSVLRGEGADDMKAIAAQVSSDLGAVGVSDYVESLKIDLNKAEEESSHASLWEYIPFLNTAAESPTDAKEIQAEIDAEVQSLKMDSDASRLISETVQALTPEQQQLFSRFGSLSADIMQQQALDQFLERKIADDVSNASLWNWIASFGPQTPVTSRMDQRSIRNVVQEKIGVDPSNYVFKSDDGDAFVDHFLSRDLTVGELTSRIQEFQSVMEEMDLNGLGVNPLYSAEEAEIILDALRDKDASISMGNIYDGLDATIVAPQVLAMAKGLRRLSTIASARIFGQAAAASKMANVETIAKVNEMVEHSLKTIQLANKPEDLLAKIPMAAPVGKTAKQKALEEKLVKLDEQASGAVSREERKALEEQKRVIGSDIAKIKSEDKAQLTKQYQAEGLKRKDAAKKANADIQQRISEQEAKLAELQSQIDLADTFSAAKSEATRIRQELAGMQAAPIAKSKLSVAVSEGITNRGSLFDNLAAANPEVARKVSGNLIADNVDAIENLGITVDNLVERVIPNAAEGIGVHTALMSGTTHTLERLVKSFNEELANLNPGDLLTVREQEHVANSWATNITRNTQNTMFSTHSSVDRVTDSGDYVVTGVFGPTVDHGYDSPDHALGVLKTVFDDQGIIKVREKGSNAPLTPLDEFVADGPQGELEYFVSATNLLRADSSYALPFEKNFITPHIPFAEYLVTPSKALKKDLFDSITAYSDRATRIAGIQRQMLDPVNKLGKYDEQQWASMLIHGDENLVEFPSRAAAEHAIGMEVSDKAWEAYVATRAYYDSVAAVRQRSVYKHLNQNGYKTLHAGENVAKDLNGKLHVRPIYEPPSIVARPLDNTDELFAPSNVWGKEVYDYVNKKSVALTDDLIEEVYQGNKVLARVSREAEFTPGQHFDFIIIKPEDAHTLSRSPMSIRKGHVDMNYAPQSSLVSRLMGTGNRGGDAFKVDVLGTKILNGEKVASRRAVGIYANRGQALEARQSLINEELAALKREPTAEDIARVNEKFPEPVLTREGYDEFGLDHSGTFGGLPAHARARGERLLGPNGLAESLSLTDTLSKSVAETRRLLNKDAVEFMRRRFAQTYSKHLENYDGFSNDFSTYKWKQSAAARGIHREAQEAHERIMALDVAISNREYVFFQKKLAAFASNLINNHSGLAKMVGEALKDVAGARVDQEIKKVAATLLIGFRVLFQTLGNASMVSFLAAQSPAVFTKDTLRRTFATMIASSGVTVHSKVLEKVCAAMAGMTEQQFRQHMKNYTQSGIARSANVQDIHALFGEAGKIEAGRSYAGSATFWKRMVPGLGGFERLSRGLMIPQHIATDFANMFAYNHAVSLRAKDVGIERALSRTENRTVAADTRRLMFNQNRTDQFKYQQNFLSTQFMFLQHVHRMYMDLLIDPALRVASFNKMKVSKDGTNLYADSYAQSLNTMVTMSAIWGAASYQFFGSTEESMDKALEEAGISREITSAFYDGLVAQAVDNYFGQEFDVQARFSPAGTLKTTIDLMFNDNGELKVGGPVATLWKTGRRLAMLKDAYMDASPQDRETVLNLAMSIASSATSGTNDAYRAMMAANLGAYVDSSGRPVADVGDEGWIPVLFSVAPEAVDVHYDTISSIRASEDYITEIVKVVNRMAMSDIGHDTDPDKVVKATVGALRSLELIAGDARVADAAKEKFLKQQAFDTDGVLLRHAESILGSVRTDKAKELLTELKRVNPEGDDIIDLYIQALENE